MKLQKVIKKYYEYGVTKWKVAKNQKHYVQDEIDLKYMYKEAKNSDVLAIVFSACTRVGLPARYNYVKTLENMSCNQLFILDDFGPEKRGSYYLGHRPEFKEQNVTLDFIHKMIKEKKPKKVIFCGSCKGGYAALNFGSRFKDSVMIIGEPTYKIATEFGLDPDRQRYWMGEITEAGIQFMDSYLSQQLRNNENICSQKVYFLYSEKDEYYERHTQPLLTDLHQYGYQLVEEKADFTSHADLGIWFSEFLLNKIKGYLV